MTRMFRKHKFVWILMGVLAVVAGFLTIAQSNMSNFRRFTSKPLPDGSRYTFLYPAFLKDMNEGPGGSPEVIVSASVYNRDGEHPFDVNRTPWGTWARKAGFSQAESVSVVVIPLNGDGIK